MMIREESNLGPRGNEIIEFLRHMLKLESESQTSIDISVIQYARLDKLLNDVTILGRHPESTMESRANQSLAEAIQKHWRTRFHAKYITIDQARYTVLSKTGPLKDVVFHSAAKEGQTLWRAKTCEASSESKGGSKYEPGQ